MSFIRGRVLLPCKAMAHSSKLLMLYHTLVVTLVANLVILSICYTSPIVDNIIKLATMTLTQHYKATIKNRPQKWMLQIGQTICDHIHIGIIFTQFPKANILSQELGSLRWLVSTQ
jgi:hypothetical protein